MALRIADATCVSSTTTSSGTLPVTQPCSAVRLSQWQAMGQDQNSLISDPRFVDPESKETFTLPPNSPAAQIGFDAWDFSLAGPRTAFSGSKIVV